MMSCISLIGMPGAGKSTVGVLLAKELAMDFVDTDVLIQLREEKTLQNIISDSGYLSLRRIEEDILQSLNYQNHVIASGGSAVYGPKGMQNLKRMGVVVYLEVALEELQHRIDNYDTRGISRDPDQGFADLFLERCELYQKYADVTISCAGKDQGSITKELCRLYARGELI